MKNNDLLFIFFPTILGQGAHRHPETISDEECCPYPITRAYRYPLAACEYNKPCRTTTRSPIEP